MGKADRTKGYIIAKTAPVFNRRGYSGTSMSDMTQTTGLTKGAIYGNFQNKDDVALAAFDYNIDNMIAQVRALQATNFTALGKLAAYIAFYRHGISHPFLSAGCPIVNTGIEADDTHPQLGKKVSDAIKRWHRSISAIIHQGIRKGDIKKDADAAGFASLMIAMIEGGFTISKISGDMSYLIQSLDQLELLIATRLKK